MVRWRTRTMRTRRRLSTARWRTRRPRRRRSALVRWRTRKVRWRTKRPVRRRRVTGVRRGEGAGGGDVDTKGNERRL